MHPKNSHVFQLVLKYIQLGPSTHHHRQCDEIKATFDGHWGIMVSTLTLNVTLVLHLISSGFLHLRFLLNHLGKL